MKIFVRIILIGILFLSFNDQANAQAKEFSNWWLYNSIDGIPTDYQAFDYLHTNTSGAIDLYGKGLATIIQGDPTKEQVSRALFHTEGEIIGKGKFFTSLQGKDPIQFTLDYGYNLSLEERAANGEQRLYYDYIKASSGTIGNESNIQILTRHEIKYDEFSWLSSFIPSGLLPKQVLQRHFYAFDRSEVSFDSENLYTKLLIFRFYRNDKVVKTMILPIFIIGASEFLLSESPGPMELVSILRKPPGKKSYTLLENSNETKRKISMSLSNTDSNTSTIGFKGKAGIKVEGIGSASTEIEGSLSQTYTEINSDERTYEVAYTNINEYRSGAESDAFIIEHNMWQFGVQIHTAIEVVGDEIRVRSPGYFKRPDGEWDGIKMLMSPTSKKVPKRLDGMSGVHYENHLKDSIPGWRDKNKTALADYFQGIINLNATIKKTVPEDAGVQNGLGSTIIIKQSTATRTITQEVSLQTEYSLKVTDSGSLTFKKIVEVGGEVSAEQKWSVTTTISNGNTASSSSKFKIEYNMQDDSEDDKWETTVWGDPVFGTPVFKLENGSATSCPYEGGFQLDQPEITVMDPVTGQAAKSAKYSDLEKGQEVIFTLNLKNGNTRNPRSYSLTIPRTPYRPDISGNNLDEPFILGPGDSTTFDLKVFSLPLAPLTPKAFENFEVIFSPDCDKSVSDTVLLSVFYGDTDLNRPPDNNVVSGALILPADGSLQTEYMNKFGNIVKISNMNTYSVSEESILTPAPDCSSGWCPETAGGWAEITNSVWFKFVVISPELTISACEEMNAGFNAQMAVYKGNDRNDLAGFQLLAANDNGFCNNPSLPWIYLDSLTIGDTLYLLVDGFQGGQSDFGLRLTSPAPKNDNSCFFELLSVDGQAYSFNSYLATSEENEQKLAPASMDPVYGWKSDSIQHSVWFAFVAPPGEEVIIDVENATFDAQIGLYGTEGNICGPEWFHTYSKLAYNDDMSILGGFDSRITYKGLIKGERYLILVDGYQGGTGSFDIRISIPVPENDDPCAAIRLENDAAGQGPFSSGGATSSEAEQLLAPSYSESGSNGWTDEPGNPFARQVEKSVWFKFIAPPSGAVEISTWNQTNFITQLAVYHVGNCDDLATFTLIASEDNSHIRQVPPDDQYPNGHGVRGSILNLTDLVTDSTYYLMIDGSLNDFGAFSIDILSEPAEPPSNDETCSAIELAVDGNVQKGFRNYGATASEEEQVLVPFDVWEDGSMLSSVWFKFIAPSSGEVEISTCDMANFDTQLAVYSVTDCADLTTFTLVAANENGPRSCSTNGDSYLPVPGLTAGQTYYIVVDGYGYDEGSFSIVISDEITPGPVNDDVMSAIMLPVNGVVQTGFTNSMATATEQEQDIRPSGTSGDDCITGWCDSQVDNSVWFKFVAPSNGVVYISTCDLADFDTQLALYEATDVSDFSTFTLIAANDAGPEDCATFYDSYLPVEGLTGGKTYYVMVDGFDGDDGSFDIALSKEKETTSIPELNETDLFLIYPNPFDGIVHLEYSKSSQLVEYIQVKDISGRTVLDIPNLDQNPDGNIQIDLSTAPSGMLFLMIHTTEGELINKKMIKY